MAQIKINDANLRNHHIYLNSIISIFPEDSIGGENSNTKGIELKISYYCNGKLKTFESDIAGDKKIFRRRGITLGTGMLLADLKVKAGDTLQFKKISDYHFEVSLI